MKDKLIFGVMGTANTGKTTMINDIVDFTNDRENPCERWTTFGSNYREEITKRGLKINREGNEESQKVIHSILVDNILSAARDLDHKRIIMDRTLIDSFVYTYWHYKYGTAKINVSTLEYMWEEVQRFSRLFDKLIWIPLSECENVDVVDDKFRDTNYEYRKQIDHIMFTVWNLLGCTGVNICTIYGTRKERVDAFICTENFTSGCHFVKHLTNFEEFDKVESKIVENSESMLY